MAPVASTTRRARALAKAALAAGSGRRRQMIGQALAEPDEVMRKVAERRGTKQQMTRAWLRSSADLCAAPSRQFIVDRVRKDKDRQLVSRCVRARPGCPTAA